MVATRKGSSSGMGYGINGISELHERWVAKPRVSRGVGVPCMLREQPPFHVEVHGTCPLISSPLPTPTLIASFFQVSLVSSLLLNLFPHSILYSLLTALQGNSSPPFSTTGLCALSRPSRPTCFFFSSNSPTFLQLQVTLSLLTHHHNFYNYLFLSTYYLSIMIMFSCFYICLILSEYTLINEWHITLTTLFRFCRIINSVVIALQLSQACEIHVLELGHVFVLFFYNIIIALIDSTLNDWGFQVTFNERSCLVPAGDRYMEIDHKGTHNSKTSEYHEQIRKRNSFTALEVLERLTESRKATILLQSVFLNMYLLPLLIF